MDCLYFLHLKHPLKPLSDPCELVEVLSVVGEVGDFEEVLKVSYGQLVACHKTCLSTLKLLLKFAHGRVHLFLSHIQIRLIDWFLLLYSLVVAQEDDLEERRSELILIPGKILINKSSCFQCFSVVLAKLFWILLAKIDQNGIAFSQLEPAINNKRNLPERIHLQVLLGSSLIVCHIHNMRDVLNLA